MKKILIIPILVFLILSCRPQGNLYYDYSSDITTWADLFTAFWNKMNTNYVFWSEEDINWDEVFDENITEFENYGLIDSGQTEAAYIKFFDITKNLKDGHYTVEITDNKEEESKMILSPGIYRRLLSLGITDDNEIYFFLRNYGSDNFVECDAFKGYLNLKEETIPNVLSYTFNVADTPDSQDMLNIGEEENPEVKTLCGTYCEISVKGKYIKLNTPSGSSLTMIVAKLGDDIVYIGISNFYLYECLNGGDNRKKTVVETMLNTLTDYIEEAKGIIIDLRGNTGGYASDIPTLWGLFSDSDIRFAEARRKIGDNRLDYGAWLPITVSGNGIDLSDVPIAVILNEFSGSAAEYSALFFKSLGDYHSYNVEFFGGTSSGAFGALVDPEFSEKYYNSGSAIIEPYITIIYTPIFQVRYVSGEMFEGRGITPDVKVDFDYCSFINGNDLRLDAALDWISGKSNRK